MAVIYTPHFAYFTDDDGQPLAGGKLYTYEAGTTTPKATYTAEDGLTPNANPVVLDASGRATLFLSGSYKFRLETSSNVLVEETDNVTAFATGDSGVDDIIANFSADTMVEADSIIFSDASDGNTTKRTTLANLAASTSDIRSSTVNKVVMAEEMGGLLGWQLLSTQTASSNATLDFTSVITSDFDTYMFVLQDIIPATDATDLRMRTSTDNGSTFDSGASDYTTAGFANHDGTASLVALNNTGSAHVSIGVSVGNASGEAYNGIVYLFNPLGSSVHKTGRYLSNFINSTPNLQIYDGAFRRVTNADVDAVRFYMSSGNITSGAIRCYGLKK